MSHQEAFRLSALLPQPLTLLIGPREADIRVGAIGLFPQRMPLQSANADLSLQRSRPGSLAPLQLKRAKHLLSTFNGALGVSEIAKACNLTRSHFSRAFKISTGFSPVDWRLNVRMERAKELLATPLSLAEVGLEAGFCDQSHFTRAFSRIVGKTPKTWRAEVANCPASTKS